MNCDGAVPTFSDQTCKHVCLAPRLVILRLIKPDCLHEFTVMVLRLRFVEEDLLVHLLQVLVAVSTLLHEFVLFLRFSGGFLGRLRGDELLVFLLLLFVQVAASRESFEKFLGRCRYFRPLALSVRFRLFVEFSYLALESLAKRVFDYCAGLVGSFSLGSLQLKSFL